MKISIQYFLTGILLLTSIAGKSQQKSSEYIHILESAVYDTTQVYTLPEFTHQSPNYPHLRNPRETYHLDDVASNGSDINKILNLLKWMHKANA